MDAGQLPDAASTRVIRADGGGWAFGSSRPEVRHGDRARLAFSSFLMLSTELALIRWITANNVYVTEATNFVLLASFLGIGIGFLNARSRRDYLRWTPLALLALIAFVLAFPVILRSPAGPDQFLGAGRARALPQPVSFGLVFLLTVAVMAGLGQGVARIFVRFRPLSAYRLDNKLTLQQRQRDSILFISANNIPYQGIQSLAVIRQRMRFYLYPYQHLGGASPGNVLIIGAGTGNDVAVALSKGARHVDAVEIDPVLLRIGRNSHPAHPYQSGRVTIHVADGRQHLQDTPRRYDLILYALPDSLTALAGQSAVRLESYLLTSQALAAARAWRSSPAAAAIEFPGTRAEARRRLAPDRAWPGPPASVAAAC